MNQKFYLSYPELAQFLFPGRALVNEISFYSRDIDVICFQGSENIREREPLLASMFKSYVYVVKKTSVFDFSLDTPEDYINWISENRGIRYSKKIVDKVAKMPEEDFFTFIKMSMAMGRWYDEMFESSAKMYQLFDLLVESKFKFLEKYYELRKINPPETIFASFLTFLMRTIMYEEQKETMSDYYRVVVRKAKNQMVSIKRGLRGVVERANSLPAELNFLAFYLGLK